MNIVKDISRRNERVDGEARDIKNNIINPPNFFHPSPAVLHGQLPESENCGDGSSLMRNQHSVHIPVVSNAASYGSFPVHRFILLCMNPGQMGVLQVYQQTTLLAEVAV